MSSIEVKSIGEGQHRKVSEPNKGTRALSRPEYKGITLKEYFRLCHQMESNHQIDEIED